MEFKEHWQLLTISEPEENGVYDVKIQEKGNSLNLVEQTVMKYENGKWIEICQPLVKNYRVIAWRNRNECVKNIGMY